MLNERRPASVLAKPCSFATTLNHDFRAIQLAPTGASGRRPVCGQSLTDRFVKLMTSATLTAQASFTEKDLPALFKSADACSTTAQVAYLRLVIADLAALVIGSLITAIAFEGREMKAAMAIAGGVLLVISCTLTWVIRLQRLEKAWYAGRAVAESVKTLAWKYAVRAVPFEGPAASGDADSTLIDSLRCLLRERTYLGADLGTLDASGEQITTPMRQLRDLSLPQRRNTYLRDRIENQRRWYANKAAANRAARARWFTAVILAQIVAAGFAFASVALPILVGFPAIFASLASALMAWLQVKSHQELAQAYGIAAHELGLIVEKAKDIQTDQDLSSFVQDAENAISREHTLWIARRDNPS